MHFIPLNFSFPICKMAVITSIPSGDISITENQICNAAKLDSEQALYPPMFHCGGMVTGIPSNWHIPAPSSSPRQSKIKLRDIRKQVVALDGSVFDRYLLGCLREARRRTMILKESSCTQRALTVGPVLGGVVLIPALSPTACAQLVVTGAVIATPKEKKSPSSLISGSHGTLFVMCWLGGGLKYVKASGNGRKGSSGAIAVHIVVDINFHLNMGSREVLTSE